MNSVEVQCIQEVPSPAWLEAVTDLAASVFKQQNISDVECSIVFCDNKYIAKMNESYRGVAGPTDVLSFCEHESEGFEFAAVEGNLEKEYIGDILVSIEYVEKNAEHFSVPFEEEMRRVIIHGLLHLLGYTHQSNEENEPMLQLQEQLVRTGDRLF